MIVFTLFSFVFAFNSIIVNGCQFDASLLICPIKSSQDLNNLNELVEAGLNVDIFQENLDSDATEVELLADREALDFLVSQRDCRVIEQEFELSLPAGSFRLNSIEPSIVGPEFHKDFRSYQNILDQLQFYTENHPKDVQVQLKTIGQSHENRDLQVIHINLVGNDIGTKPIVWIMATQHAREWISTSTALFIIQKILNEETRILNHFEFAILPLANPDGYEYSRNVCRLWRKNRRYPEGVDMNRNWDINWSRAGGSNNPNSNIYHGPGPASEPEVQSIQDYILNLPNILVGFDLHSFGQLILRNYAWTHAKCPHESFLAHIGNEMSHAIAGISGVQYKSIRGSSLYPASGSAADWMYEVAGFPGFILELRDRGRLGFQLPAIEILPVGEEIFAAIETAIYSFGEHENEYYHEIDW